jgi:hypothetical protein
MVAFESPHRPEPCLEPAMIGLDPLVRVPLQVVERAGHEFVDDGQ